MVAAESRIQRAKMREVTHKQRGEAKEQHHTDKRTHQASLPRVVEDLHLPILAASFRDALPSRQNLDRGTAPSQ